MTAFRIVPSALAAACFLTTAAPAQDPLPWPQCLPAQVEVILLGTFHMAGSSDETRREVDDVLSPTRQAQMVELVERLAGARPDKIALEADVRAQGSLNEAYRAYRAGAAALTRNERQQLGFRLAARLDHDSVYAVDYPRGIGNDSIGAFYRRHPDVRERSQTLLAAGAELLRPPDPDSLLAASTLLEYFAWINSERALISEGNVAMYAHIVAGEGDNYGGADLLTGWFERNIRMAHHVARIVEPDDRRVLFIVGSGHVRPLRDVFDLAPQFCPVSPVAYLMP